MNLSEKYGLMVDPDAIIEDITVGMQQRVEILKMLYRDNEIKVVANRCTVLRKGKYIGTVNVEEVSKENLSEMMVVCKVNLNIEKELSNRGKAVLGSKKLIFKFKE